MHHNERHEGSQHIQQPHHPPNPPIQLPQRPQIPQHRQITHVSGPVRVLADVRPRNSTCHFCDHAAKRPGRSYVALMVPCGAMKCRRVFCSRGACMRKLPQRYNVQSHEDFERWKKLVESGEFNFICPHCQDESTCRGPQCRKRWEKKQQQKAEGRKPRGEKRKKPPHGLTVGDLIVNHASLGQGFPLVPDGVDHKPMMFQTSMHAVQSSSQLDPHMITQSSNSSRQSSSRPQRRESKRRRVRSPTTQQDGDSSQRKSRSRSVSPVPNFFRAKQDPSALSQFGFPRMVPTPNLMPGALGTQQIFLGMPPLGLFPHGSMAQLTQNPDIKKQPGLATAQYMFPAQHMLHQLQQQQQQQQHGQIHPAMLPNALPAFYAPDKRLMKQELMPGVPFSNPSFSIGSGNHPYMPALFDFLRNQTIKEGQKKFRCVLCTKLFLGSQFVHKHIINRHQDFVVGHLKYLKQTKTQKLEEEGALPSTPKYSVKAERHDVKPEPFGSSCSSSGNIVGPLPTKLGGLSGILQNAGPRSTTPPPLMPSTPPTTSNRASPRRNSPRRHSPKPSVRGYEDNHGGDSGAREREGDRDFIGSREHVRDRDQTRARDREQMRGRYQMRDRDHMRNREQLRGLDQIGARDQTIDRDHVRDGGDTRGCDDIRARDGQDRNVRDRNERDRNERERNERERNERERNERERNERERNERERNERERNERERNERERERNERERNERDHNARNRSDLDHDERDHNVRDRIVRDRDERNRNERDQNERDRNERDQNERDRNEQDRNEQDRNEQDRNERDRNERDRTNRDRTGMDRNERDHSGWDRNDRDSIDIGRDTRHRDEHGRDEEDRDELNHEKRDRDEQDRSRDDEWKRGLDDDDRGPHTPNTISANAHTPPGLPPASPKPPGSPAQPTDTPPSMSSPSRPIDTPPDSGSTSPAKDMYKDPNGNGSESETSSSRNDRLDSFQANQSLVKDNIPVKNHGMFIPGHLPGSNAALENGDKTRDTRNRLSHLGTQLCKKELHSTQVLQGGINPQGNGSVRNPPKKRFKKGKKSGAGLRVHTLKRGHMKRGYKKRKEDAKLDEKNGNGPLTEDESDSRGNGKGQKPKDGTPSSSNAGEEYDSDAYMSDGGYSSESYLSLEECSSENLLLGLPADNPITPMESPHTSPPNSPMLRTANDELAINEIPEFDENRLSVLATCAGSDVRKG